VTEPLKISALIAGVWPESATFTAQIEKLAGNNMVRGVRRVLHTMPPELSENPLFAENLRRLPKRGLTFDLCLRPHLLRSVTQLVSRCAETQFVLDHCGVPNIAAQEFSDWAADIRELAARPNVACKFSGLAGCCDPRKPLTPQVRPYFEHCLACFRPERMMWGSDWPVCSATTPLSAWLRTSAELLGALSAHEQAAIGHATAQRVYRIE
jgi:predicted TIM-barrel fold metal-dependent hydrolase